ncbi:MAG: zf-TFIIB domain-containing protein [Pseudomonadota bacterium]
MEVKTYGRKITLHRCCECAGLFCDPEVLREMRREWMSEVVLDTGDIGVGRALNQIEDIMCPACGIAMQKTFDPKQTHIWFESCEQCEGIYLDAGEFTDLKFDTLMDRLRDFLKGRRPAGSV